MMTASAPAVPALKAKPNKWLVTVSVTFGTLMGAIDTSIINVALPHIRGAVGATLQEITWISTGYVIATVLVMPLTAFLGRRFGQKRVYMSCLAIFLLGSALCGLARSLTSLIVYRAIQGFGAGALQPTEQAILRQTFDKKEQGTAMALFSMAVMLGPAIGPTLGGYIVDNYAWPWIFYINIPVGILGLFMVATFVQEDEEIRQQNAAQAEKERHNMDWAGIALLSMGLACLQYFLEEGARNDWFEDTVITLCLAVSVVSLVLFVIRELTAFAPVVNLRLFKDPVFTSGTLMSALMFAMLMAGMFLLPIFMEELLGFTATQSGLALVPRVMVMMVVSPIVGKLYAKVPVRVLVAIGVVFYGLGAYEMSHFNLLITRQSIIPSIMLQGIGFSMLFVPLSTISMSNVPRHLLSDAAGLSSLLRQIGGSVGLAVFATLLDRYAVMARAGLASYITPERVEVTQRLHSVAQMLQAQGVSPSAAPGAAMGMLYRSVAQQAMVLSFDRLFFLAGALFLFILPLLIFLKSSPSAAGAPVQTHMEH